MEYLGAVVQDPLAPVAEDSYNEEDDDSCGSTVGVGAGGSAATGPTPPDSPLVNARHERSRHLSYPLQYTGKIVPELDIYAIPCKEGKKKVFFPFHFCKLLLFFV